MRVGWATAKPLAVLCTCLGAEMVAIERCADAKGVPLSTRTSTELGTRKWDR